MVEHLVTSSVVMTSSLGVEKNVLISFGDGDEGLFYQAPLGRKVGPSSFAVYFHSNASMLERLRLFGCMRVKAQFANGMVFLAQLISQSSLRQDHHENIAVLLELGNECGQHEKSTPCFLPLT